MMLALRQHTCHCYLWQRFENFPQFSPTIPTTTSEPQNPWISVSGQHKTRGWTDLEALELWKGRSGSRIFLVRLTSAVPLHCRWQRRQWRRLPDQPGEQVHALWSFGFPLYLLIQGLVKSTKWFPTEFIAKNCLITPLFSHFFTRKLTPSHFYSKLKLFQLVFIENYRKFSWKTTKYDKKV